MSNILRLIEHNKILKNEPQVHMDAWYTVRSNPVNCGSGWNIQYMVINSWFIHMGKKEN